MTERGEKVKAQSACRQVRRNYKRVWYALQGGFGCFTGQRIAEAISDNNPAWKSLGDKMMECQEAAMHV